MPSTRGAQFRLSESDAGWVVLQQDAEGDYYEIATINLDLPPDEGEDIAKRIVELLNVHGG